MRYPWLAWKTSLAKEFTPALCSDTPSALATASTECKGVAAVDTFIDLRYDWLMVHAAEIRLNQFAKMAPHIISISDIPKVC